MENESDIFKIKTNNVAPKKGRILIAEPFLAGHYFNRSVILLVAYSTKGAVGFVLNKQVDFPLHDAFPDFPEFNTSLYLGGPVSTDSIYFVHKLGEKIPGSIPVMDGLYWGGDFEAVKREIRKGFVHPSEIRFFLGYSGWDAGQLEDELKEDSWLVADSNCDVVMQDMGKNSWFDFVKRVGSRYSVWRNFPQNPSFN